MAKPKAVNVKDLLRQNSNIFPVKKNGRSQVPLIDDAKALADSVHELYEEYKLSETKFRNEETFLIEKAKLVYEKNALNNKFTKSVNFEGSKTHGMQVTFQDKFTTIPIEHESELKKILGKQFDDTFQEKRVLKLNDTSDETITLIQEKLGQELFLKLFSIDLSLETVADMDKTQFKLPDAVRAFLNQYKPSSKIRIG